MPGTATLVSRTVIVRNLEIRTPIGVHPHEKKGPQRLLVSVEAEIGLDDARSDRLDSTLDYDRVCDFIRSLARGAHVELQETVAASVLDFALSLPGVVSAVVETRKPDVFDDCDYVGVRVFGKRDAS